MKSLSLIVLATVSLGTLALSGCTSCMPQMNQAAQPAAAAPVITCGPGTVIQGTTCIGPNPRGAQ